MTDIIRGMTLALVLIAVNFALIFIGNIEGFGRWAAVIGLMAGSALLGLVIGELVLRRTAKLK